MKMNPTLFLCVLFSLLWKVPYSSSTDPPYLERYVYSERSCEDLIPHHSSYLTTTSTTTEPSDPGVTTTTTRPPTTRRTTPRSPAVESLRTRIVVTMLNGYRYAPGRRHSIIIRSLIPFEGFMVQVRKNASTIVGTFIDPPPMTTTVTCPSGLELSNTAVDNDAPVMLNTITLIWRAPPQNLGTIILKLSLVIGREYQIVEKSLAPSALPPLTERNCGLSQSCFRACPRSLDLCAFPHAVFATVIRNSTDNASAIITLGVRTALLKNYGAIGFTLDHENLSEMDLNMCYTPDVNRTGIEFAHLYLENKHADPLPHQGVVFLSRSYMDESMLWCEFSRPLIGNDPARLNLDDPTYVFFFRGFQHNEGFDIPRLRNMMRVHRMVSHSNGVMPFNKFIYLRESDGNTCYGSFTLVTLLNVFCVAVFYGYV